VDFLFSQTVFKRNDMSLSLNKSVRTCKVDQGYADRIQSARFQDSDLMVCPNWQGFDNAGRTVSPDSFVTKTAGCSLPMDRVAVENYLRPMYMTYINLDASGYKANLYGEECHDADTNMDCYEAFQRNYQLEQNKKVTGSFSTWNPSNLTMRCNSFPYELALAQENNVALARQGDRVGQNLEDQFRSQTFRHASGM